MIPAPSQFETGSTIAAAQAVGYDSLGVELDADYFRLADKAIPRLAALHPDFTGSELEMDAGYRPAPKEDENQLSMLLSFVRSISNSNGAE